MNTLFALLFSGSLLGNTSLSFFAPVPIAPLPKKIERQVEISAKSALIMEVESGVVVWEKNAREQRAVASLTKLMTALLIFENHALDETAMVPSAAPKVEGKRMFLLENEKISVRNLLRGLLITSGNDAAITLALFHEKSVPDFARSMNRRAYFLGMKNTHFQNPHGLDEKNHYSTAFDLALLSKSLLRFPEFRNIVSEKSATIFNVDRTFKHEIKTTNALLRSPFPVFGLKTGTTDEAGQCLIALVRIQKREFLIVILGSEDRFYDAKTLLWALGGA